MAIKTIGMAVLFLCLAMPGYAGDDAVLNIIGFSQDGKYAAFEQYGTEEGSAIPYAEIYIVDVPANRWIGNPFLFSNESVVKEEAAREKAKTSAEPSLKKYGIIQGNTGASIAEQEIGLLKAKEYYFTSDKHRMSMESDFTLDGNLKLFETILHFDVMNSHAQTQAYQLKLQEIPYIEKEPDSIPPRKIVLTLIKKSTGETRVLQKDDRLPKSRKTAFRYKIHKILVLNQSLAIFIRVSQPGFEGPNTRYMVVTGVLY